MTLLELLQLMRKHLKLMIVLPIVCALATAVVCFVALPNTYTASTSMYVLAEAVFGELRQCCELLQPQRQPDDGQRRVHAPQERPHRGRHG